MKKTRGVYEKVPGSGEWWVRHPDANGRLRREKIGRKAAAIALYQRRKTEAREGKKLPETLRRPPVSFAEIAKDALVYSKAHKRTHEEDVQRMKRICRWFGDRPADGITPQDIERHFQQGIDDHKWAPSTVNHHRSLISLCYRLAIRNGKVSVNPARATRHRREDNSRVRYLKANEEVRLREVLDVRWPGHVAEFDLALHTGLRRSEMYGLDWQDVDLSQKRLLVRQAKNGESRYVRLNSIALKALAEFLKRGTGTGPVIRNLDGEHLQGPRHWFDKAAKAAKFSTKFRWHDIRHTFASRLAMENVGLRAIQEALGHKSIAMTVRYSHLAPDFMADVVERLVPKAETAERTDTTTDTTPSEKSDPEAEKVH